MTELNRFLAAALCTFPVLSALNAQNYKKGNPSDPGNYSYLDEYKALKEYIDYEKYPNFKVGIAISADEYLNTSNKTVYNLTNDNFTEVVTGNDMKMASCVRNDGTMDFNTVTKFVNKATSNGLRVYGHTLGWHAQQPIGWLKSLIKDKDPDTSLCDTTVYTVMSSKDFTKNKSVGWHASESDFGYTITFDANGLKVHTSKKATNFWDIQYIIIDNVPTVKGQSYKVTLTYKATGTGTLRAKLGDWSGGPQQNFSLTNNWQTVTKTYNASVTNSFMLCQSGDFVGDIWIKEIKVEKKTPAFKKTDASGKTTVVLPAPIPLTAKEKKDTLTYALDKWISGIMNATDGKVKAWDLANEAISGGNPDQYGFYALQHDNGSESDFFWQDYLGDREYVQILVKLARKYYAQVMEKHGGDDGQLKLFINDYNLESDWDGNQKVKSLVRWIKRWESDGVTKIDGIGSQMHISCYMNQGTQNSKKNAIENSFKIMAQSGKLVRISELDMGMVDANGNDVPTSKMTEAMHQKMASYYEWIIKKYLEIIPPAQQWGICQWCATDSPSNSGWRANTPVGLWTLNTFYRKHTYAGFARGLWTNTTDNTQIETDGDDSGYIYSLKGIRQTVPFEQLPQGFYIVDGKLKYKQ